MKFGWKGILISLVLACMIFAPLMDAKKPTTPNDNISTSRTSTLTGDFVSGPTPGQWTSYKWLVLFSYASNIPNSPGGPIKIYDVPDRFATGTEGERNILVWETHGEEVIMKNARGKYIKGPQMKPGEYTYPSSYFSDINIMIKLAGFIDEDGTIRMLTFYMSDDNFDEDDQITISVSKTTVTFAGDGIPFDYFDWHKPIWSYPYTGNLGVSMDHDFEITIDK